jgi:hypothetical protein
MSDHNGKHIHTSKNKESDDAPCHDYNDLRIVDILGGRVGSVGRGGPYSIKGPILARERKHLLAGGGPLSNLESKSFSSRASSKR